MDDNIVSRETIRQRGADAFDRGIGIDGHEMNWFAPAIEDWQFGWHARRIERSRKTGNVQHLEAACPP